MSQDRDEWLMMQLGRGRGEHLEALVRRHASPLLTFIRRMVADEHASEELFQEVFLAVWKYRRRYRFPRPFKPWLYQIAINKCREAFRRAQPVGEVSMEEESLAVDDNPSPAETAIAAETATLVTAAVTRLPPGQRTVVVLRIWNGLSYAEIADIVGRSEATVRSHMHHGLTGLRKYLEPKM